MRPTTHFATTSTTPVPTNPDNPSTAGNHERIRHAVHALTMTTMTTSDARITKVGKHFQSIGQPQVTMGGNPLTDGLIDIHGELAVEYVVE